MGPRRIGWPSTPCLWTPTESAEIRTAGDVQPGLTAAVQAGDRWLLQADQGAERPQLPTVRMPRATAAAFSDHSVDLSTGSIPLRSPTTRSCSTGHADGAILSQFKDGSVVSPRLSWPALIREAGLEPLSDLPRHLYRVNAPMPIVRPIVMRRTMGAATKQPGPLEWPGVDSLQHDAMGPMQSSNDFSLELGETWNLSETIRSLSKPSDLMLEKSSQSELCAPTLMATSSVAEQSPVAGQKVAAEPKMVARMLNSFLVVLAPVAE